MRMYIITILLLQSRQISETAGAACRDEVFQCPTRWMSSKKFLEGTAMWQKKDSGEEL